MTIINTPRPDYPRPDYVRQDWLNLNGEWEFEFDDSRIGVKEKWFQSTIRFLNKIQVPFAYQSQLSGIEDVSFHDVVWYRKQFVMTEDISFKRTILNFGAVDYMADVWVNGQHAVTHEGGHTPFKTDITNLIVEGENTIVVRAEDFSTDITLPRGKQYWKEKPEAIWYTNTTGIWQTVWLESTSEKYIEKVEFTPFVDTTEIEIQYFIEGYKKGDILIMKTKISFEGDVVIEDTCQINAKAETRRIRLQEFNEHHLTHLWTPEKPYLYDVQLTLLSESNVLDDVKSYFGMRKVSVDNGTFFLNNRPYYMKLVLDQGYFPGGNLTPPSDEAIRKDIELTKAMGFNGVRKHQKVEDPRYLYWCDKMGLLVWGEMANALEFSAEGAKKMMKEWQEVIDRDYNHPCIVAWVPINESWGIPKVMTDIQQQHHAMAMYYITKSIDETRLVVSNDGWELVKTDLCNIHDYEWKEEILKDRYSSIEKALTVLNTNFRSRKVYANGYFYENEPILVSEFGGIAFKMTDQEGWGYSGAIDEVDFLNRFKAVVEPLKRSPVVKGFCYTQLTDVMQEINGLLTYDRMPKVPLEKIREIIE
jgi:beta-galactosidase/beta-glucuronidase